MIKVKSNLNAMMKVVLSFIFRTLTLIRENGPFRTKTFDNNNHLEILITRATLIYPAVNAHFTDCEHKQHSHKADNGYCLM